MTKLDIDKLLAANLKAARHEQVIRETLSNLERLKEAGVSETGYNLSPAYGQKAAGSASSAMTIKPFEMTYCA